MRFNVLQVPVRKGSVSGPCLALPLQERYKVKSMTMRGPNRRKNLSTKRPVSSGPTTLLKIQRR